MNHFKTGNSYFGKGSYKNNKYNGKELQETGMYSYGWREYMPDIARWNGIDQLAEMYTSTYAYVANNPVSYADVDGRWFNQDGSIDTSGTANGFVNTRAFMNQSLGQFPGQGGGGGGGGSAQALIDRAFGFGGDWYNTGSGFAGSMNIGLGYDGSYTSLNTNYDEGGIGERIIDIPGVTVSGSSFFWGAQAQSHFNSYMGRWNASSDFTWSRATCGHCNDGPVRMMGGDMFGFSDLAGIGIERISQDHPYVGMALGVVGLVALKKPGLAKVEVGGGATLSNLTLKQQGIIQSIATKYQKPIAVVGSRAKGTATIVSDWDYIIKGNYSRSTMKSIRYNLPKGLPAAENFGRTRIEILGNFLDETQPYILFNP